MGEVLAASLDQPNICTVHEVSETTDGSLYLALFEPTSIDKLGGPPLAMTRRRMAAAEHDPFRPGFSLIEMRADTQLRLRPGCRPRTNLFSTRR